MAYFVNPDGTITPADVSYNSDGSIHIVQQYESDFHNDGVNYRMHKSKYSHKHKIKNKNNKNRIVEPSKVNTNIVNVKTESIEKEVKNPDLKIVKKLSQKVDLSDMSVRQLLKGFDIKSKTISSDFPSPPEIDKGRRKRKLKKKHNNKDNKVITHKKHNKYASSVISFDEASIFVRKGNKPKFAYARDRFGRIQERDHFNEERKNEFEQGRRKQSNYDYSNFDINDDNDGAYDLFE